MSLRNNRAPDEPTASRRILFPFLGSTLSERTLEATLRLARRQESVLMPAYMAIVPRELSLSAPLGGESAEALALLELIEQRAAREGVEVDSRIQRGRSPRHALAELIAEEHVDAIVLPARTSSSDGFDPPDIAWALEHAPGELLIVRPSANGHG